MTYLYEKCDFKFKTSNPDWPEIKEAEHIIPADNIFIIEQSTQERPNLVLQIVKQNLEKLAIIWI